MKKFTYSENNKTLLVNGVLILIVILLMGFNAFVFNSFINNTEKIHHANYLGTLSQQITKTVITLRDEKNNNINIQSSLSQLTENLVFFRKNLNEILESIDSKNNRLFEEKNTKEMVLKISKEWESWEKDLNTLLKNNADNNDEINYLISKLNAKNIYLLSLTDDYSLALKINAVKYNDLLNKFQIVIFLLSVSGILVFGRKYKNQLDSKHNEKIYQEMMLQSLNENLFLVDLNGKLLKKQLQTDLIALDRLDLNAINFTDVFKKILNDLTYKELIIYINYITKNTLTANSLNQLNPIKILKFSLNNSEQHLLTNFGQILHNNKIVAIFVRISNPYQTSNN